MLTLGFCLLCSYERIDSCSVQVIFADGTLHGGMLTDPGDLENDLDHSVT